MHRTYMPWKDVRLSVCPSVCHTPVLCLNRDKYPDFISSSGSPTILVFPYQTRWQYSDGDPPNGGVECNGVWKNHDFRPISGCILLSLNMTWSEPQCSCVVPMIRGINSKDERGNDNIIACDDNGSSMHSNWTLKSQQCLLPYKTRRSSNCRSSSSVIV